MQLEGMMAEFVYVDNSNADIEGKLVSAEYLNSSMLCYPLQRWMSLII